MDLQYILYAVVRGIFLKFKSGIALLKTRGHFPLLLRYTANPPKDYRALCGLACGQASSPPPTTLPCPASCVPCGHEWALLPFTQDFCSCCSCLGHSPSFWGTICPLAPRINSCGLDTGPAWTSSRMSPAQAHSGTSLTISAGANNRHQGSSRPRPPEVSPAHPSSGMVWLPSVELALLSSIPDPDSPQRREYRI